MNRYIIRKCKPYIDILHRIKKRLKNNGFILEIPVTDHCNLNCIGCSHFSPLVSEKYNDISTLDRDCEQFSKFAKKHVNTVFFTGGEPLLHPEIAHMIQITSRHFDLSKIKIVTNAMILDQMSEEFWLVCKTHNVCISITPYPININVKKISELSVKYGVDIEIYGNTYKTKFRKDVYDLDGLQNVEESFDKCCKSMCHQLYEGKFYLCPSPLYVRYFNEFFQKNMAVVPRDYLDIYEIKDARTILSFIKKPIPFCKYCDIKATDHLVVWGKSQKEIGEWT
jgi:hypothetical protein